VSVARTLKVSYTNPRIRVTAQYAREGSILAGTIRSWCESIRTELDLDSDEPAERVGQLNRLAEASCFTLGTVRSSTPVELVATLNGQPFEVDALHGNTNVPPAT
jgi:hypothetical protein